MGRFFFFFLLCLAIVAIAVEAIKPNPVCLFRIKRIHKMWNAAGFGKAFTE